MRKEFPIMERRRMDGYEIVNFDKNGISMDLIISILKIMRFVISYDRKEAILHFVYANSRGKRVFFPYSFSEKNLRPLFIKYNMILVLLGFQEHVEGEPSTVMSEYLLKFLKELEAEGIKRLGRRIRATKDADKKEVMIAHHSYYISLKERGLKERIENRYDPKEEK